ncbi:MAG: hypothetical protein SGBAC_004124 [Bacillariaceae sp.]
MYESHAMDVHRMEAGKRPARHSCYRGLEKLCRKNLAMVDSAVYACIDAVMDEQQRQWDESSTASADWELYREASLEVSRHSEILAYKMAMCDEREARKAYVSMANREFKLKIKQESCKSPSSSAGTEATAATDSTNSTMAHEAKDKHHKMKNVDSPRLADWAAAAQANALRSSRQRRAAWGR